MFLLDLWLFPKRKCAPKKDKVHSHNQLPPATLIGRSLPISSLVWLDMVRDGKNVMSRYFQLTLQGTNISHLGKRKIIFKSALGRDILVPRRNIYKPPGMYKTLYTVNDSQSRSGKTPRSCASVWICIKPNGIWDVPLKRLTSDFWTWSTYWTNVWK